MLVIPAITSILVLQKTKQALLPAKQTPVLWGATAAVAIGVAILLSGWGRDSRERARHELDTLADDFYPPRRGALINGGAILAGVVGSLWWATATWAVVLGGMRRNVMARGLLDFEVAAIAGALTGGVIGAVLGLAIGHAWEVRHRRRREQRPSHA
jgi:hypothetical protein